MINNAPGLDEFNMNFYKHQWVSFKREVMNLMNDFYSSCSFYDCINALFITNYRPISLIDSLYKILKKVVANRLNLRLVVKEVVGECQFAVIKG